MAIHLIPDLPPLPALNFKRIVKMVALVLNIPELGVLVYDFGNLKPIFDF
jgi:hypothetical protein